MITQINTLQDVTRFAKMLTKEQVAFHPDDDFADYVDLNTGLPFYTSNDAELRNNLMDSCIRICEKEGADIYEIMQNAFLEESDLKEIFTQTIANNAEG